MPNIARSIAAEIVTVLNAGTWSKTFTAERIYDVRVYRDQLDTLKVGVIAVSQHPDRASRSQTQETIEVDIAVRQHVDSATPTHVDPLMDLLQELLDHFMTVPGRKLPSGAVVSKAATVGGSVAGMFVGDLETLDVFTGVVRLTVLAVH